MIKFIVPVYYTFYTRYRSIKAFFSWLMVNILPLYMLGFIENSISLVNITQITITIVLLMTLYEVGYIQNDTETIKMELKPTIRLNKLELAEYEKNKIKIYSIRILTALFLTILLYYCFGTSIERSLFLWLLVPLYFFYNKIRNRWNLLIHFLLVSIRFMSVPIVMGASYWLLISAIFLYPIPYTIERSSEKRFNVLLVSKIIRDRNNIPFYRVIYYAIAVLLLLLVKSYFGIFLVYLYFFLYRLMLYVATRFDIVKNDRNYN